MNDSSNKWFWLCNDEIFVEYVNLLKLFKEPHKDIMNPEPCHINVFNTSLRCFFFACFGLVVYFHLLHLISYTCVYWYSSRFVNVVAWQCICEKSDSRQHNSRPAVSTNLIITSNNGTLLFRPLTLSSYNT